MTNEPIKISWDELGTRKVDQRLKEQQAVGRNRAYAQMDADQAPVAAPARPSLLHSTLFWLAAMGVTGGVLAWAAGLASQIKTGERQALDLAAGIQRIEIQRSAGMIDPAAADASVRLLKLQGSANPYFQALTDPAASPDERGARASDLQTRAATKHFALNVVSFGLAGLFLAACLCLAEPISERNIPAAVKNGALGAVLGLAGGAVVALFVDRLYRLAAGNDANPADPLEARALLARGIAWGTLGLFLTIGPGLLMRNARKLAIGAAGGVIGGLVGGLLFNPVERFAGPSISRLLALVVIGLLAGLGTGLIENAAKTGWLKVTRGLIAGKQFILYRNPTFIGSGPDCQIYLFRDPKVGRRHAALHLVPGGIELEDLPLGTPTLVNGKPVSRVRLRNGDQIAVGGTAFLFQEK